jgi:putative transposase
MRSRRIVGWSMAATLASQLVLDALNMALATRRPNGVIHHSDQGSQYTSEVRSTSGISVV